MANTLFTGCATALITPFKEGQVDKIALEKLVETQIEQGIDALRLTAYRMIEEVMEGFSTNTSPLSRFTSVPLLVLDDLGTEPMIPNVTAESLFAIADQRNSSRLATVYISNLDQDELATRYQERIASRITDASITKAIYFRGDSLRGVKEKNR